jgi:citrate lyase subunit beta / citryl-CoA lyase
MTTERRLRRSELSTPGHSERMIQKAAAGAADLVFLDLEDSVAPPAKAAARATVASGLKELDWGRKTRAVRVNGPESEWIVDDITHVATEAAGALDVIIVPKVKSPEHVVFVEEILAQVDGYPGIGGIGLEVLIEEVEALLAVEQIAKASGRLEALIFGSGDLAASQGVRTSMLARFAGDPWQYHRTRIVLAARAAGVEAIDGPYWGAIADVDGYREECLQASILGFSGKWAIHPSQIAPANESFSPSPEELAHAQRVLDACREAEAEGRGAIALDGVMVDAVDVRLAEALLERERALVERGARAHG